jgi:hypothetical protein
MFLKIDIKKCNYNTKKKIFLKFYQETVFVDGGSVMDSDPE